MKEHWTRTPADCVIVISFSVLWFNEIARKNDSSVCDLAFASIDNFDKR